MVSEFREQRRVLSSRTDTIWLTLCNFHTNCHWELREFIAGVKNGKKSLVRNYSPGEVMLAWTSLLLEEGVGSDWILADFSALDLNAPNWTLQVSPTDASLLTTPLRIFLISGTEDWTPILLLFSSNMFSFFFFHHSILSSFFLYFIEATLICHIISISDVRHYILISA